MENMRRILVIFVSFLLVLGERLAEGCICEAAHPQEHFCLSDYVIKGEILSKKELIDPGWDFATHMIYQVQIDKVFKGEDVGLKAGDFISIKTYTQLSLCGNPYLAEGSTYLMTGRVYHDTIYHEACNLAIEWQQVTVFQRKGLRNFYRKTCGGGCQTRHQYGYYFYDIPEAWRCNYNEDEGCETKYSTCIPHVQDGIGSCIWLSSPAYDQCVLNRDGELGSGESGSGFL